NKEAGKDSAYLLVDEAHKVFDIDIELNYSIGEKEHLNPNLIKASLELYEFLDTHKIQVDAGHDLASLNGLCLADFLKQPDLLHSPELVKKLMDYYEKAYPQKGDSDEIQLLLMNQFKIFLPST